MDQINRNQLLAENKSISLHPETFSLNPLKRFLIRWIRKRSETKGRRTKSFLDQSVNLDYHKEWLVSFCEVRQKQGGRNIWNMHNAVIPMFEIVYDNCNESHVYCDC